MSVINTNTNALIARDALSKVDRKLATEMERLSTGKRINSAKDDAAGLAISNRMTSQIRGLDQAVRNSNDAISMLQTADGATIEITNMLQRMRELAVQSRNDTNNDEDREFLDLEFQQLASEVTRIADTTEWNAKNILNTTTTFVFQIGANSGQTVSLSIGNFRASASSASNATDGIGYGASGGISSSTHADSAISAIDDALDYIAAGRATIGAMINRLAYTIDNLTNVSVNTSQSRSRILDTDFAKETADLARDQIIKQAATAMLAQANQQPQTILSLLKQ